MEPDYRELLLQVMPLAWRDHKTGEEQKLLESIDAQLFDSEEEAIEYYREWSAKTENHSCLGGGE